MKKICLLAAGIIFSLAAKAQVSESYPLWLSQYGLNGTANYVSRAGAMGAVGGDFTAASYNPAGLGLYRMSEITFSAGLNFAFTNSTFNGLKTNDDRTNFNVGNLGAVMNFDVNGSAMKNFQFGFGFNKLKDYSNRTSINREGVTNSYISSIFDIIMNANDLYNDYVTSGVISVDTISDSIYNLYDSDFLTGVFNQYKKIETSGYLSEMTFSFSTNINDVVYLGATIGVPLFDHKRSEYFTEECTSDPAVGYYNGTTISELSGAGANFKLGAIVKPVEWLRLGAAIHTPTYYSVSDYYYSSVEYNYKSGGDAPDLFYDIQSPFRFIGSLALVLGDNTTKVAGTLSADYEYANYANMKYRFNDDARYENEINNKINNKFQAAHSLRLGGELKIGVLALRAGYAVLGNPYAGEAGNDASQQYITGGIGYRAKSFFFDLGYAYTLTNNNTKYYFYDGTAAMLSHNEHLVQATIGFRF
ncbi:MAG: hypothetical protein LBO06_06115 [Bacteroidales bacterium]|jgi:hypothetical protein|nr:hypothetical protein [Bacteroidales bacterium]